MGVCYYLDKIESGNKLGVLIILNCFFDVFDYFIFIWLKSGKFKIILMLKIRIEFLIF